MCWEDTKRTGGICMNWKKSANLFLSMLLAFSTMMSDVTVYAEGEEETEEPVIEEVTETEETSEPEVTEIVTEEEVTEVPETTEVTESEEEPTVSETEVLEIGDEPDQSKMSEEETENEEDGELAEESAVQEIETTAETEGVDQESVTDAEEETEEQAQTFDGESDFEFAITISSGKARIDSVTTSLTTQYDLVIPAKVVSGGIEYSVSSIKDSAFKGNTLIKSVSFEADSEVETLGKYVFQNRSG